MVWAFNEVTLVNISPEKVPDAIPEVIQAGQTWDPFASEALSKGAHIIFSSAETPGLTPDVLIFRTAVIKERPDDIRAFIKAWFEALAYWQANPAEGNALIAQATERRLEQISTEGIKLFSLEDNLKAFENSTELTSLYQSGRINADFMINTGVLIHAPKVERILEPSFLQ